MKLQQNLTQEYNFSLVFNFYFYRDWVCDKIGAFCSPLNQEKCGQIFACFREEARRKKEQEEEEARRLAEIEAEEEAKRRKENSLVQEE